MEPMGPSNHPRSYISEENKTKECSLVRAKAQSKTSEARIEVIPESELVA